MQKRCGDSILVHCVLNKLCVPIVLKKNTCSPLCSDRIVTCLFLTCDQKILICTWHLICTITYYGSSQRAPWGKHGPCIQQGSKGSVGHIWCVQANTFFWSVVMETDLLCPLPQKMRSPLVQWAAGRIQVKALSLSFFVLFKGSANKVQNVPEL